MKLGWDGWFKCGGGGNNVSFASIVSASTQANYQSVQVICKIGSLPTPWCSFTAKTLSFPLKSHPYPLLLSFRPQKSLKMSHPLILSARSSPFFPSFPHLSHTPNFPNPSSSSQQPQPHNPTIPLPVSLCASGV